MDTITLRGPKGCAGTLSFGGETYTGTKKGIFIVPTEAAEQLQRHGFVVDGDAIEDATGDDAKGDAP